MKTTTKIAALAGGGVLLAASACGGSGSYSLADGTQVPGWATGVVAAHEEMLTSQGVPFGPQQVRQALYVGSVACTFKNTPVAPQGDLAMAADQQFCRKIEGWLTQNAPGGIYPYGEVAVQDSNLPMPHRNRLPSSAGEKPRITPVA